MIHMITLIRQHGNIVAHALLALLLARASHYQQVYEDVHKAPSSQP
jgi:hypothetical protein